MADAKIQLQIAQLRKEYLEKISNPTSIKVKPVNLNSLDKYSQVFNNLDVGIKEFEYLSAKQEKEYSYT